MVLHWSYTQYSCCFCLKDSLRVRVSQITMSTASHDLKVAVVDVSNSSRFMLLTLIVAFRL